MATVGDVYNGMAPGVDPQFFANKRLYDASRNMGAAISNRTPVGGPATDAYTQAMSGQPAGLGAVPAQGPIAPAKAEGALTDTGKVLGDVEKYGPEAVQQAQGYIAYQRAGGVAGAYDRMTPAQRLLATRLGTRAKHIEVMQRSNALEQTLSNLDSAGGVDSSGRAIASGGPGPGADAVASVMGWKSIEPVPATEATSPAKQYRVTLPEQGSRATGDYVPERTVVMTEDGLKGQVRDKMATDTARALGRQPSDIRALMERAPQLPWVPAALEHVAGTESTFLNKRTGQLVQLPMTPEQVASVARKGVTTQMDKEGRFWSIKTDASGKTSMQEVVGGPPALKTYEPKRFTQDEVVTGDDGVKRMVKKEYEYFVNPHDPTDQKPPRLLEAGQGTQPAPDAVHEHIGQTVDANGKKHAVTVRTQGDKLLKQIDWPAGVTPEGMDKGLTIHIIEDPVYETILGVPHVVGYNRWSVAFDANGQIHKNPDGTEAKYRIGLEVKGSGHEGAAATASRQDSPGMAAYLAKVESALGRKATDGDREIYRKLHPEDTGNTSPTVYPTATNPTTGEKRILKDGKWQPAP
jgi:hypothetical protein